MILRGVVVIVLFYLACIIALTVLCIPRGGEGWLSPSSMTRCEQPELDLTSVQGVFNTATDIYVLYIPMHLVLGLRLKLPQKIGVCALFLTGLR